MSDTSIWIELAKQVPALAVLVVLVVLFLKFLREEREDRTEAEEHRLKSLEKIGDDCHTHSQKMLDTVAGAMEANGKVIQENTRALGEVSAVVRAARSEG